MAGVIGMNSIIMSLELDIPWGGWACVENVLQIIYTFELSLRLKRQGCYFFVDVHNLIWNYLDSIMVAGGMLDLWLMPAIGAIQGLITGHHATHNSGPMMQVLRMLKIMRILRVLRLVRLLKMIKPLYVLLMGVMESVRAMQWVLVLTFLTLYACSIVFTNLVGKGLMGGPVSDESLVYFGSVPASLFSLFKLMNGDTSVVEPITDSISGQLLFAVFMVVSNWSILAILTSVVSDNMISSSTKANEEDDRRTREENAIVRKRRLNLVFEEVDKDGSGCVSSEEWETMLADEALLAELIEATDLDVDDLNDYFQCLADDPKHDAYHQKQEKVQKRLMYSEFIRCLNDEGVLADKRSILNVKSQLRNAEGRIFERFDKLAPQQA
jgi:hypothetical protein